MSWKRLHVLLYMCKRGTNTIPLTEIQQTVVLGVLKDTNFATVSTAPARLHLLDKAQFGLRKAVLSQLPGFFSRFFSPYYIYLQLIGQRHCQKCHEYIYVKKKEGVIFGGFDGAAVLSSVCRGAGGIRAKTQHLNHCFVFLCFVSSHFSVHRTPRQVKPSGSR